MHLLNLWQCVHRYHSVRICKSDSAGSLVFTEENNHNNIGTIQPQEAKIRSFEIFLLHWRHLTSTGMSQKFTKLNRDAQKDHMRVLHAL